MPTSSYDFPMTRDVRVLTAFCAEEAGIGNTFVLSSDTSLFVPVAFVQAPSLQFHGYLHWTIAGTLDTNGVGSIGWRLSDNNAAISGIPAPSIAFGTTTGGVGAFIFECDLIVLGSHDDDDRMVMRQTWTIINADETEKSVTRYYQHITTIDQRTDHQLGFSVTLGGTAGGTVLDIRSINCLHFAPRSDS